MWPQVVKLSCGDEMDEPTLTELKNNLVAALTKLIAGPGTVSFVVVKDMRGPLR
jgi:hypothetical protein